MRRRYLVLVVATSAVATFVLRTHGDPSDPVSQAAAMRAARFAVGRVAARGLVSRVHYRLAFEERVTVPGKQPVRLHAEGEWTTTPWVDGRTEVRFTPATLEGVPSELPRAEELDRGAQLVAEQGVLSAIGFPAQMPVRAKKLLTALATTFSTRTDRARTGPPARKT